MDKDEIKNIVERVVEEYTMNNNIFPVEVSARHVHLTQPAVEKLFGKGEKLEFQRALTLPGFLAKQRVSIVTKQGVFSNVAVLGPVRKQIQVEISAADARNLGLSPPVNLSGDLNNANDVLIIGNTGVHYAKNSTIIARAHLHISPEELVQNGLKNKQIVDASIEGGKRSILLKSIVVRADEGMHGLIHIDTDEANACGSTDDIFGRICINDAKPE